MSSPESGNGSAAAQEPATPPAAPTCYRHAGRETYIRCARCDRPICADCMVSAAVGFQCPDCVRSGRASVPRPRTVLGGRASMPGLVTKVLIALNVAMFILGHVLGPAFIARTDLLSRGFLVYDWQGGVAHGEWYRLLTAAFLHQAVWHILANMWSLWVLGPPLEQVLGRLRFVGLYLLCALGGSAVSYLFLAPGAASLGASGAIFGLFGALLVVGRKLRYDLRALVVVLVLNLVLPFTTLFGSIDWHAHLGGLATGVLLGFAFAYAPRSRRNLVQLSACVAVLVVVVVLVAVRTGQLTG